MKLRSDNAHLPLSMLLAVIVGGLAIWLVQDFSSPLSDGGDTDFYEYVGYFFAHNLTLRPVPHLNLLHDQTFYPYGANHTLLDWGWERDYWYAICYWVFGKGEPGPYLQYYYVYSLLVSALGTFWLLQKPFGTIKAFVAGLVVSVFNFYCVWKFPVHLNISVIHWTTLCIIATYRILYELVTERNLKLGYSAPKSPKGDLLRVCNKSPLGDLGAGQPERRTSLLSTSTSSPTLWLLWMWLHIQVLSQELGYVAGFALTFTSICAPFLVWRAVQAWRSGARLARFGQTDGLLILLILISLWLYLPLTLQIFAGAQTYADAPLEMKPIWSHPLRLLIPYLPGLDVTAINYKPYLHDWFESYGQGSPGLYLIILGMLGFWQLRRKPALWVPIGLMLVLCLFYHPVLFPTLKLFPWFSFNRHGGRASLVYPVLFMLLSLSVRWPKKRVSQVAFGLLIGLMLMEWAWGFRYPIFYNPKPISASLLSYMKTVHDTSGEAVLDFPFCTIGADGVGDKEGLCPYYLQQNAVFTFKRFHQKKVVGQYWGRLHPTYIQPFLNDNWPRLLQPGHVFTPADWQFLDRFLRQNKFAGINLFPNLLTPAQQQDFYVHFGKPVAQSDLPMAGKVQFLRLK